MFCIDQWLPNVCISWKKCASNAQCQSSCTLALFSSLTWDLRGAFKTTLQNMSPFKFGGGAKRELCQNTKSSLSYSKSLTSKGNECLWTPRSYFLKDPWDLLFFFFNVVNISQYSNFLWLSCYHNSPWFLALTLRRKGNDFLKKHQWEGDNARVLQSLRKNEWKVLGKEQF